MTDSYTTTQTTTFTKTHAVHIAAKVATDLKRMQRFYHEPSDEWIQKFEAEIVELLKHGYVDTVKYGFKRNGCWIEPTLHYAARDLSGMTANDDDPGRIQPGISIGGASFSSYLTCSSAWDQLSSEQKKAFARSLPFQRRGETESDVSGYWSKDHTYSAGNRALDRFILRSSR